MKSKKAKLIAEALSRPDYIAPCDPPFTYEPELNKMIHWFDIRLENGAVSTSCVFCELEAR